MRKCLVTLLLFCSVCLYKASAQSLYKVSLDEKISNASLIVEGKVIDQHSFWNPQRTMIYTSHTVELLKVFKGSSAQNTIEVLTVGGSVGANHIEASDLLTLEKEQLGVFFCYPNSVQLKSPLSGKLLFDVYASSQGFLSYDLRTQKAKAPFAEYAITDELYTELQTKTGSRYQDLKPSFKVNDDKFLQRTQFISIDAFAPDTVNAGALLDPSRNLLTISGVDFGTPSGVAAILFDDANNGTGGADFVVNYNDPLVVSWTNTEIKVRVPSRAGTGYFRVRDAAGNTSFSPYPLNVFYSILNTSFFGNTVVKESNLMNHNGLGGYSVVYSITIAGSGIDFDASPAKPTFQRALATWKEISGFNVVEAGTTFIQTIADDDVNVVMYDNANTGQPRLAAGTLAVCYSYNTICTGDLVNFQAQKTGFDIIVRNPGYSFGSTSFTYGPCPPASSNENHIDLETVLLHELGHALNLGHINDSYEGFSIGQMNPGKLMNYTVLNGLKRVTPDYSAKQGAAYAIMPQGNAYGSCNLTSEMTPSPTISEPKDECPLSFPTTITPRNTTVSFDLVHATSNKFVDPTYDKVRCDGVGASQTNNAWYAIKTNSHVGGTLNLTVTGYTTVPAELATCPVLYPGIPVTGIRLSVYQVSSCPAPFFFPTPVACRTITANGGLAPIPVSANTNYLIYVEGIENTKATFDLTLGGLVLPVKLKEFSGKAWPGYNVLSWSAEALSGIEQMTLQKSNNGVDFADVATFHSVRQMEKGEFKDVSPFAKTYYRLAFKNATQQMEYSSVVPLQQATTGLITVYPNPAKEVLNVQLKNTGSTVHTVKLYNNIGQLMSSRVINPGIQHTAIPLKGFAKGAYNLVITGNTVETHKVVVE